MADPSTPPIDEKLKALKLKEEAKAAKAAAMAAATAAKAKPAPKEGGAKEKEKDGGTKLGMSITRTEDFGAWYSQVVVEARARRTRRRGTASDVAVPPQPRR